MPEIESKLVAHDRHQFELKLGYTLDPKKRRNRYRVTLYFFIPKSLTINQRTYAKEQFFNDIQGYIRFTTPSFSFEKLVDETNPKSPLTRIKAHLDRLGAGGDAGGTKPKLIAELKLYACMVRVTARDNVNFILGQLRKLRSSPVTTQSSLASIEVEGVGEGEHLKEDIARLVESLLSGLNSALSRFRELNIKFLSPTVHEEIRWAYKWADEYIGIVIDEFLNALNNAVLKLDSSFGKGISDILSSAILNEFRHRRNQGYAVYFKESDNESFLYRKGFLKKFITSILFLETHTQEAGHYIRDISFALAAGIAMVVATAVAVWAGQRWAMNSLPFVVALVVGYMVKDRIKDWCKGMFSKNVTRWLADLTTDIRDPETGAEIGTCRQAMSYVSEKKVPHDVIALRKKGRIMTSDGFWIPEEVIKYEKEITLKPRAILKAHSRLGDITDIIRFNVRRFLERMDEPYEAHRAYDPDSGQLIAYNCSRVYHVNLILETDQLNKIRLVLNKDGLKRIENVR